jgi:hypothetical protein
MLVILTGPGKVGCVLWLLWLTGIRGETFSRRRVDVHKFLFVRPEDDCVHLKHGALIIILMY